MQNLQTLISKPVELAISGKPGIIRGNVVDIGQDVIVIFNGSQYLYVPLLHMQYVKQDLNPQDSIDSSSIDSPFDSHTDQLSYRKILLNAKGTFVEIFVTGNQPIHGYITSIMNDYFVFYSPVFHNIFVPLNHLKYLIPYTNSTTPYTLDQKQLPLQPTQLTVARTFDQQLKKLEGKFVVLDLGLYPGKIGLLKKTENMIIELITAKEGAIYIHLNHIKTIHLP